MKRRIASQAKFILAVAVAACAGSSMAIEPVKGSKPAPVPVQSQETLAAQQKHNGRVPIVGSVELKPREEKSPPKPGSSGKELLKAEGSAVDMERLNDAQAAAALGQVELDRQMESTAPFRKIIWAVVVVAFGLGLAFLVKFFADKSMPQVPSNKSKVNW